MTMSDERTEDTAATVAPSEEHHGGEEAREGACVCVCWRWIIEVRACFACCAREARKLLVYSVLSSLSHFSFWSWVTACVCPC